MSKIWGNPKNLKFNPKIRHKTKLTEFDWIKIINIFKKKLIRCGSRTVGQNSGGTSAPFNWVIIHRCRAELVAGAGEVRRRPAATAAAARPPSPHRLVLPQAINLLRIIHQLIAGSYWSVMTFLSISNSSSITRIFRHPDPPLHFSLPATAAAAPPLFLHLLQLLTVSLKNLFFLLIFKFNYLN